MDDRMRTWPLLEVVEHNPGLKSFYFETDSEVQPGQFIMLWLPGVDEKPFSVSDVDDGRLEVTVKAVGPFTRKLMECRPGERLGLRGPFGRPFAPAEGPPPLLVGGGCGVAPLRFLHRHLERRGLSSTFLVGVRTAADLMFREEYAGGLAMVVTDDGSLGERRLLPDKVGELLANQTYGTLCAAGPEVVLSTLKKLAESRGIPSELSYERHMKCAVGLCGECCLEDNGLRLCVEGPVLRHPLPR